MADVNLTAQYTKPELLADGLWHNWFRYADEFGNAYGNGYIMEFVARRLEDLPSTTNNGTMRLLYMLNRALQSATSELLRSNLNLLAGLLGGLLGWFEGFSEDIPIWFTGEPVWTDFPHPSEEGGEIHASPYGNIIRFTIP